MAAVNKLLSFPQKPKLVKAVMLQGGGGGGGSGGGGGLYGGDAHVVPLTSSSFPGSKDQSVYLVEFYAPW